jgi:4-hydroxysphinganine ceramide fatty acyl 2-hydroxylase
LNAKVNFDYKKGLLYQVFQADFTFDEYVTYINEPKHLVNPIRDIRLFDNNILEACSMAPWWLIPVAYIPWMSYTVYRAWEYTEITNPLALFAMIILGMFWWSFTEYTFHRFFFHGEDYWMHYIPHNKWVFTGHFMIHGIHHAFPQDRYRLVFPPVPGYAILGSFHYYPWSHIIPEKYFYILFIGWLIGYIAYDEFHYFMHHSNPKSGYMKDMKLYHMQHHYKFGTIGFGVSSKFWDYVFKSDIRLNDNRRAPLKDE